MASPDTHPPPQPPPPPSCQMCKDNSRSDSLNMCVLCNNLLFCNTCWPGWMLHDPKQLGNPEIPHEKMNPRVVERIKNILEPSRTEEDHERELGLEEDTTWFGVTHDHTSKPVFQDHGRFATLMAEGQTSEPKSKYPQLVSFIGQTGAGKSTIIKMLINQQREQLSPTAAAQTKFPSPVTSSNNDRLPTTGDVHLYADPLTYSTQLPILYADCEGLNGGEAVPKGLRCRDRDTEPLTTKAREYSRKHCRRSRHSSQRDIMWANTPERRKREYAVTQLYPRLLYTFSDVVVFVLRNPRAFESTVLKCLVEWGAASIHKSLNQPALPHAIILLNATEKVDEKEWDVETSTKILMTDIKHAIRREPMLEGLARTWRESGRKIRTTRDLLECYYASVTCIRVPRDRYMLMDQQVNKLFHMISSKSEASLRTKKQVRMLTNSEILQLYLQSAYDHFSKDLDVPFDFVKEALRHNPIPRDLGGNILNLAISIMKNCGAESRLKGGQYIFKKMAPMIASCIFLDSVRQNLLGTGVQLLQDAYIIFCRSAIEDFALMHWPCDFRSSRYGKCRNVKSGHNPKGHQNEHGRIIGSGDYESDFDLTEFFPIWIKLVEKNLERLQNSFNTSATSVQEQSDDFIAWELHLQQLQEFYTGEWDADPNKFVSHVTCFCCLRELPEYPLPCGHVLCFKCVSSYGRQSKTLIELSSCPLHTNNESWYPPWEITIKPKYAGTRVLSLDGGGVRGILSLQVLKAVERILGPKLPLQAFFDLIVGTSTGGIIALGLGAMNWSIDQCIHYFKTLVEKAFTPRELKGFPGLEQLAVYHHGSKYKTRPFEEALKLAFDETPLFGGDVGNHRGEMMTKVAITTTSHVEQHPVVMANYNRPVCADYDVPYTFLRTPKPDSEMKIWEAARASSAAVPYFKPFQKPQTGATYIDGALYHNCPVLVAHHERKLIWGDITGSPPDLLLSVGTGKAMEQEQPRKRYRDRDISMRPPPDPPFPNDNASSKSRRKLTKRLPGMMLKIAADRFDNIFQCDRLWSSYMSEVAECSHLNSPLDTKRRFIRLNPGVGTVVPHLDSIESFTKLEDAAKRHAEDHKAKYVEVAHRLVASTFFFEKDPNSVKEDQSSLRGDSMFTCAGTIHCRFRNNSDLVKALGELLLGCLGQNFDPCFTIEEVGVPANTRIVPIKNSDIDNMAVRGDYNPKHFQVDAESESSSINISLCLRPDPYPGSSTGYLPISGFPRRLMSEDHQEKVLSSRRKLLNRNSSEHPGMPDRFQTTRRSMNSRGSDSDGGGSGGSGRRDGRGGGSLNGTRGGGSLNGGSGSGGGGGGGGGGNITATTTTSPILRHTSLRRDMIAAPSPLSVMSATPSVRPYTPSDMDVTSWEDLHSRRTRFLCELEAPAR